MITTFILITLILYGTLSIPFWILLIFHGLFRKGKIYRITIKGRYIEEFEKLLANIIITQRSYYGSKIKVEKL